MHVYDVNELLYLKCEVHGPWGRGSRGEAIWRYGVNAYNFKKNHLHNSYTSVRKNDFIIMLTMKSSTKIVNFISPGVWVLTLENGQNGCILVMHIMFKIICYTSTDILGKLNFVIQEALFQNYKVHVPRRKSSELYFTKDITTKSS